MSSWHYTSAALRELKEVLKCKLCQKIPDDPVHYSACGHFSCKSCIKKKKNNCPICGMLSLASEITSEHLINNLITGMNIISDAININSKVDGTSTVSENDKRTNTVSLEHAGSSPAERNRKKSRNSRSKNKTPPIACTEAKKSTYGNSQVRDINKRNAKGETQLHVACIKGNIDLVKKHLENGASPNTKDYAGWTPLLEAVNHGFVDIVKLLLQFGVMVNVPGYENITPLHEAVSNGRLEIVQLLLKYGANRDARSISGITPRDLAQTDEMKQVLNSEYTVLIEAVPAGDKEKNLNPHEMMVFGCGLDKEQQKQLVTLSLQFKFRIVQTFQSEVTHIVVQTTSNGVCSSSKDVIQAILQGKWIINFDWIAVCLDTKSLIFPEAFEVKGTCNFPNSEAPSRGRINAEKQLPGIFNGCHIFLAGLSANYTVGDLKLTKGDVMALVQSADGVNLSREPDPEGIPQKECTVPYHATGGSTLAKCSHYIIYRTGKEEPKLKYNMSHIKSLPLQWLYNCMETFSLVEPF